ncbi:MAG: metalloregulator ArsR/SmtB family transcription factor [Gammaproteobacteria bacterium]|nr:metalloregulator ArsR/SmtB family transcription factor [Gammaproteobacteria bacterium]MDH5652474.1 metalloregulator ArsR/SmtB family transcription factor [Gammaproteobacteria bacterium]
MEISNAVERLSALAQASRLSIFRRLIQAGPGGMAAGDISQELAIPPPTLSFHLKDLTRSGLIRAQREGRSIIYQADYQAINDLIGYLKLNCCQRPV